MFFLFYSVFGASVILANITHCMNASKVMDITYICENTLPPESIKMSTVIAQPTPLPATQVNLKLIIQKRYLNNELSRVNQLKNAIAKHDLPTVWHLLEQGDADPRAHRAIVDQMIHYTKDLFNAPNLTREQTNALSIILHKLYIL